MAENEKTKAELAAARARLAEMERMEAECKAVVEALRESEETAHALLNAPTNVAFLLDDEGKILAFNEPAQARIRMEPHELYGRVLWEILPPDVVGRRRERFQDAIRTKRPIHFDEVRPAVLYENLFYPLFDEGGDLTGVAAFCWEVEARRRLAEVLGGSEKDFRAVADTSSEGALELDGRGEVQYANAAALRLCGCRKGAEVRGRSIESLLARRGDGENLGAAPDLALDRGAVFAAYVRNPADGEERPVLVCTAEVGDSFRRTVRVQLSDITERENVEAALRAGDGTRALAATTGRYTMLLDLDGQVTGASEATFERIDVPRPQVLGRSFVEFIRHEVSFSRRDHFSRVVERREPLLFYDEYPGAAYENDIYPILDSRGEVARVAYFGRDVTERRRVEAELEKYRQHLEELVEERTADLEAANVRLQREIAERRRAAAQLAESEERFRRLVDNFRDGLVVYDFGGDEIAYANPAAVDILGVPASRLRGWGFEPAAQALVHAEDLGRFREVYARARAAGDLGPGRAADIEFRIRRPDGEVRWIRMRGYAVSAEGDPAPKLCAILADVTARREAEAALRESEERYRRLVETSPDAIAQMDLEGKIVAVNRQTVKLYGGAGPEDVIGQNAVELIEPARQEAARRTMEEVLEQGAVSGIEYRVRRKDGTYYDVEVSSSVVRDGQGNPQGFLAVIRDVSARKRAERKLEYFGELTRNILQSKRLGIYALDADGRVALWNPGMERQFEVGAEEVEGRRLVEVFPALTEGPLGEALAGALTEGKSYEQTGLRHRSLRKGERIINTEIKPLRDGDGRVVGVVVITEDVTDAPGGG
ncbi:MAG: PAS domain S-box protein [Candidatus Coatesbacteria bacterium]|nr:MAG: PAS domain S-box protein [Candidatus Coatesbacteria bacterium]